VAVLAADEAALLAEGEAAEEGRAAEALVEAGDDLVDAVADGEHAPGAEDHEGVGVNFLKWDIKIVTLALGYAVLIPNAIAPGNVKPIDDRNGRFIFDVGITF